MGRLVKDERTLGRARRLRKEMTDPERILWMLLRDRRFADWKFRRQAPLGDYVVDFVCFSAKVVIELDGLSTPSPSKRRSIHGAPRSSKPPVSG